MLKPEPEAVAWVTVVVVVPVLLRVPGRVCVVPICTCPKLKVAGVVARAPEVGFVGAFWEAAFPVLNPWQPTIVLRASKMTIAFQFVLGR